MHVHLPKPVHGWREFLNEVAIIVVGILIALGGENVVERMRWAEETSRSTEAVKGELEKAAVNAWERMAVQPCLTERLRYLTDRVGHSQGAWQGAPLPAGFTHRATVSPVVYTTPLRPFTTDAWQNVLSAGVYGHLSERRADELSDVYRNIQTLSQTQAQEGAALTKLSPLGYDLHLSGDLKVRMLENLAEVDRLNSTMNFIAKEYIDHLSNLHLKFKSNEVAADKVDMLNGDRKLRGACVADLPLNLN